MAATPAWPPHTLPRLFVDQALAPGALTVEGPAANYLGAVLRLGAGDAVKLFDDRTGEWLAEVRVPGKRRIELEVTRHLSVRETVPDLWLLAAPIKKGRIDWLVEKACELGVARIVPVLTRRTIVDRLNLDRLRAHMIEAAEQCGRTALPALDAPEKLERVLAAWPTGRQLLFADEAGGAPLPRVARAGPAAILIGPEGGFTDEERSSIRALADATPVTLGPRILRADTAMAAAVSLWMGAVGDWRDPGPDRGVAEGGGTMLGGRNSPSGE